MNDMKDVFRKAGYKGIKAGFAAASVQSAPDTGKLLNPQQGEGIPQDYVARAEQVITGLRKTMGNNYKNFTTTKIRNILSMVNQIYNDVLMEQSETLSPDIQSQIKYLKVRLVYECGREPRVIKPFVSEAGLLSIITEIGDSRKKFIEFSRYMEALVAYHRFYGGE